MYGGEFGVKANPCAKRPINLRKMLWIVAPFEGLGTTFDVHLGLIRKRLVDFLLVLIELFSLGVTAESLRAKIDRKSAISLQCSQFHPKF